MEADKFGIVIIQSLREKDKPTGEILKNGTLKYKQFTEENLSCDFYEVHDKKSFFSCLEDRISQIKKENYFFLLHLETHGCEDGIILKSNEIIYWEDLFLYTRRINQLFDGYFVIVLAMCDGMTILKNIDIKQVAPFSYIIGASKEVAESDMLVGFEVFYEDFFFGLNPETSIEAMNNELGYTPPLFYGISSEYFFNQVVNPDRDPDHFKYMVHTHVRDYFNVHPKTRLSLSEVANKIDRDLRDLLEAAKKRKNDFLIRKTT